MGSPAVQEFRVIQGCPCPKLLAPYIAIVVNDARATVNSIYRGADAEPILHKHGKHSQAELYALFLAGRGAPANPPGFSTHEQRSDGSANISAAYHVARGSELPWWGVGFDVNDSDTTRCISVAGAHGWDVFRPYSSGAEFHHLNFSHQPHAHTLGDKLRIARLRATLPRS